MGTPIKLRMLRNDGVACDVVFQDQGDSRAGYWRSSFTINGEEHFSDVEIASLQSGEDTSQRRLVEDAATLDSLGFSMDEMDRAMFWHDSSPEA